MPKQTSKLSLTALACSLVAAIALFIFVTSPILVAMELNKASDEQVIKTYVDFNISNPVAGNPQGDINSTRANPVGSVFNFDKSPPVRVRPDLSAKAYMIIDPHTGTSIVAHNEHTPLPPASLTKIMTAYVAASYIAEKKINIQDEVKVSPNALRAGEGGSRMWIEPGRAVTIDQLLIGLLAISGNDAAVALAEHIAGTETDFAKIMNEKARELGMVNCYFTNSHGLHDDEMLCSLNDLMLLCQALLTRYPAFYDRYFGIKQYSYAGVTQRNRNRLLFYAKEEIDGIKTGHTSQAGYNLIVSGIRNGYRTISGVMGTKGESIRDAEVRKMMDHTYVYYRRYLHYEQEEKVADLRIRRGKANSLAVGLANDLYSTLPYTEDDNFKVQINVFGAVVRAPIAKGQEIAELQIVFDNSDVVLKRPLVALEQVEESNPVLSILDELLIWLGF